MQRISISVSKRAGTAYGLALKTRSENTHKTVLLPGAGQRAPSPKRSNRILERFFGRAIPRSGHSQKSISNQNLPDPTVRDTCGIRSEEHTSELQSHSDLVCRLLLEKKKNPTCESYVKLHEP